MPDILEPCEQDLSIFFKEKLSKKEKSKLYFKQLEEKEKKLFEGLNIEPIKERAQFGNVVEGVSFSIGDHKVKEFDTSKWIVFYDKLCRVPPHNGFMFQHPKYHNMANVLVSGYNKKNFKKLFITYSYKTFIDPIKHLYLEYCFRSRRIVCHTVKTVWKMKDILEQNKTDNIDNISPLCFHFKKSPKELKEYFGKALWKKLCKNSKSRNKKLCFCLSGNPDKRGAIIQFQELPSTLLCRRVKDNEALAFWWWKQNKDKYPMKTLVGRLPEDVRQDLNYFKDTLRFISNLRLQHQYIPEDLYKLSIRRIKELHEELLQEIMFRQIRHKESLQEDYPVFAEGGRNLLYSLQGKDGWTATLLTKGEDILAEGLAMHHCVAAYADSVAEGKYLIYSIKKDGERYSTLAYSHYRVEPTTKIEEAYYPAAVHTTFNQHYKVCNKIVDNPNALELQKFITEWYSQMNNN